jgi:hypothetical protein
MIKCTKGQVRRLKTALRWKIPPEQRQRGRAGISASTLRKLRKDAQISDKSLFRLVRAAEQLRHETEPVAAVNARWLQKLREFLSLVGVKTSWRSCWASLGHISGECGAEKSQSRRG